MRSLVALLSLFTLPVLAAPPGPPDKLTALFYDEGFVQQVESGRFDPFRFWTGAPRTLVLEGRGRLKYTLGLDWETCTLKAKPTEAPEAEPRAAAAFTVEGKCKANGETSDPIDGLWEWLDDGRVRVRLSPHHSAMTLRRLDKPYAKLVEEYEAAFHKRWTADLKGAWARKDGELLEVTETGAVKRRGKPLGARILECVVVGDDPPPRTACILFGTKQTGRPEAVAVDPKTKELVPGVLVFDELHPDGRAFEPTEGAERYWKK